MIALSGGHPWEHYEREGVGASPDTWQDNMREVLLENTANRTIATEKGPRLCFWFSFVTKKHPVPDELSCGGKKCHRHPSPAQDFSPATPNPASGSGCVHQGSLAQEGPLGQLLLLTCAYPRGRHQPGSPAQAGPPSISQLKSLLSGDFQPMPMFLSPG